MKPSFFTALIFIFTSHSGSAQSTGLPDWLNRMTLKGYGTVTYSSYDWQTDPEKRDQADLEKLVLYSGWNLSENLSVLAEIEFEHGGTGSAMEFDKLEEFGEFEQEIEKGGEVVLEQLNIRYRFSPEVILTAGWMKIPIGLASTHDEPHEYFTVSPSESESALIPVNWYEGGVGISGQYGFLSYTGLMVTGLDGTGFSSANWIRGGYQKRFETVTAENPALFIRLDALLGESVTGISVYRGNSTGNRPKPDLKADAVVTLTEFHTSQEWENWIFRGMVLYGTLSHADLVTKANKNLSNNLNVKRTPVASAALSWSAEAGYNILPFFSRAEDHQLFLFGKTEFYDSMYEVTGIVLDNPRFERTTHTFGLHYLYLPGISLKAHYSDRTLGLSSLNREKTLSVGLGFEFE